MNAMPERGPEDEGQQARRLSLRLVLFGAAALTAFAYGFLFYTAAESGRLLQRYGYYVALVTFLFWLHALWRLTKAGLGHATIFQCRAWLRESSTATALITGLTFVAMLTVPYSYKVLFDEAVLQSTAWNLHSFREFAAMLRGYEVEGTFRSLFVYLDKRPIFFPFLVSLVHDLTGFRQTNAFLLNTLLFPASLLLLYSILRGLAGPWPTMAGLACFGASSLLAQIAGGSGMEMLNLVMILLTLRLAVHYLESPEERRLSALVLSCVLLAQTRYESALYVAPVALVILDGWRRAGRMILPFAMLAAPLLLIPYALHSAYLAGTPMLWELHADTPTRFSAGYLWKNLTHAGHYFLDFTRQLQSSWWLSLTGFPALMIVAICGWRWRRTWKTSTPATMVTALFGFAGVASLGLLMFYYWGQLDDHIVCRLVLPFNVTLALAITWSIGRLPADLRPSVGRWIMAGALVSYLGFGAPTIAYHRTINQQAWEMAWEVQWLAQRPSASRLIITNKSSLDWVIRGIPSISISHARQVASRIEFHQEAGTFEEVLVSQYYRPSGPEGGFVLEPKDALPTTYELEPLIERQVGGKLLRISRVKVKAMPEKKEAQPIPDSENPSVVADHWSERDKTGSVYGSHVLVGARQSR